MTQKILLPAYSKIASLFDSLNIDLSPAEVHGRICAAVVLNPKGHDKAFVEPILKQLQAGGMMTEDTQEGAIADLVLITYSQLVEDDCRFELLLPSDETSFGARVKALSLWCAGFLSSLGEFGLKKETLDEEDLNSFLSDLAQIAVVPVKEEQKGTERDESDYVELVEYVRVGVISLYDNFV